ncbi:MAG TPA: arylsulfatase, partial [Planctomycetota bacterium]|nr:arylsulfatase [Planctomycetota bacterium]
EVFYQISESQIGRGIRTEKWKYSVSVPGPHRSGSKQPAGDVYHEEYLYDLENDPHERWNLVGDPAFASVRAELAETLKRRMSEAGEGAPEIRPAANA